MMGYGTGAIMGVPAHDGKRVLPLRSNSGYRLLIDRLDGEARAWCSRLRCP